jgi:hypothetical protein
LETEPVRLVKGRGPAEEWADEAGAEAKIIMPVREVIVSVPVVGSNFPTRPGRRVRRGLVQIAVED